MAAGIIKSLGFTPHGAVNGQEALSLLQKNVPLASRFPQAFCIYEGGIFPSELEGAIIAPNALQNLVWASTLIRDGSTYRTVDQENLLESPDRWFRPVYGGVGPDGAFYLADWYDTRLSHVSPIDDWHKESGRVYRVIPEGQRVVYQQGDLHELPSDDLIDRFTHANKWVRRRAMLELGWRDDGSVTNRLTELVDQQGSLESLWALNLMGELTLERAGNWLTHENPHIRRWVIRLLGDRRQPHPKLAALAVDEEASQVRSQLASTAKRLPSSAAIPIMAALLRHDEDVDDPQIPLLLWWAVESHADDWEEVRKLFTDPETWQLPLVRQTIVSRMMQRYAAAGSPSDLEHCAELLELAPDGVTQAIRALASGETDLGIRLELAKVFGELRHPEVVSTLLSLATGRGTSEPALQRVAIASLGQYADDAIPTALVGRFGSSISAEHGLRSTACRTLASRPEWAMALLKELNEWRLRPDQVPADVIQQLRTYRQPEIAAAVEQAFGKTLEVSAPEKMERLTGLRQLLTSGQGDAEAGKEHFMKRCGNCHQLFGEGKKVGPPLDGYDRGNLNFWLPAIVEPSLEIREGFQSYLALTVDGRAINGMIAAQDPDTVTLRNADNQLSVIDRDDIETLKALETSLMPDDVLKEMSEQELRDLFAYLSQGAKPAPGS